MPFNQQEHYYFSVLGLGAGAGSVGAGAGSVGAGVGASGAGAGSVGAGVGASGVGVIGREGLFHRFSSCPTTFLLGCWVGCCFLAICFTSFGPNLCSTI